TDRIRLGRIIGNLLGNAIKFTDRGHVRVETRRRGDGGAYVIVADTGIGISAEHQGRIFDEFFQLSDPQRSKGSGLGLSICKRLSEAMGGEIRVDSEPSSGSTFKVVLPASAVLLRPESQAMAGG